MTRKQRLEDIVDWLLHCVVQAEADGYQSAEDEAWNRESAPSLTMTDDGTMIIQYDGRVYHAKIQEQRKTDGR